jgi:hypothetical protein
MSPFAALVVLAQVAPSGPTSVQRAELMAAAQASPRPAICVERPTRGQAGRTLWDRARRPAEATFCDALARGYSLLTRQPAQALAEAERAKKVLGKRAEPSVLAGRALMQLGRAKEAWTEFERAQSLSRRSVEEPAALHDVASAAYASGHRTEALALFRRLVPRATLLSKGTARQRVYLEAALLVMAEGPENLNEATGYLVEARRFHGAPGLADVVTGALALALDRQGQTQEAHGVAAEAGGPGAAQRWIQGAAGVGLTAPPGELHAIAAILAERDSPETARAEWKAFVESEAGKSGKWAEHGKKRMNAVSGVRRPKGR